MNDREILIDRVRKLLAKAESTDNPNEAEAFSAKAAELIAAHRLDPAHVRDSLDRGTVGLRRIPIGRATFRTSSANFSTVSVIRSGVGRELT